MLELFCALLTASCFLSCILFILSSNYNGFEINLLTANNPIKINNKLFTIPDLLLKNNIDKNSNNEIRDALIFNKNLLMENLIIPNRLKFPLFRNILESYYI